MININPPSQLSVEKSLIGSIILDKTCASEAFLQLSEDDFYSSANKIIFIALKELFVKDQPFDVHIISEYLRSKKELETIGGETYIASTFEDQATSTNINNYIDILKHKTLGRKLIGAMCELENLIETSEDYHDLTKKADATIYSVLKDDFKSGIFSINEISKIEVERCLNRNHEMSGIPTGFREIDQMTLGLQRKELIILGGFTSNGKTSLALGFMLNMASLEYPCAYFTPEMSKEQILDRCYSLKSGINLIKMRYGLNEEEKRSLVSAHNEIENLPIFIDDSFDLSVFELRAKVRNLKIKHDISIIYVDYLQMMDKECYGKNISTNDATGKISRGLKKIAKEFDIAVVALSQLKRQQKQQRKVTDHRPHLSDLRDSGNIEQDADLVMLIHREELYDKEDELVRGKGLVIIAKQRNGDIGDIELGFEKKCARYYELKEGDGF